ncbi:hypothetical protein [Bacillus sp. UNCCL81]|uniref:hypothetical protein n=1 Tax=Bacillus sp. UNCCL81 TaxID=1502755 RepID=UPI0008EC192B|nr:hypothetical protein [Bacillus sp. UNCCL81]SFD43797.1 hypothetical protein SAMN02799633_03811 [Bacillus sp. UNCCL81]
MNKLQRDLLYRIKEEKREDGVNLNRLASKVNKDRSHIEVDLAVLEKNNFIELHRTESGKMKRAKITALGESHFDENTTIINKENIADQISELKNKVDSLEKAFSQLQEAPTEENKKSLLEKIDTVQSVVNGISPLVKGFTNLFT